MGFGHAEDREVHHFVAAIPRSPQGEVMVYEVFSEDPVGPALDAPNLRVRLDMGRWLKIADALEEEFNRRLRAAGMKPGRWKAGANPIARLLGKELVLLAWAIRGRRPRPRPRPIQNWRGLAPEERWWLYTMTAAQTGHHGKRNTGWRKAVRFALTENPTAATTTAPTAAERRARSRGLAKTGAGQGSLFDGLAEDQAAYAAGIWEEQA